MRNNWQDLGTTLLKHIENSLNSQESVRIHLFADTLKEDRKIVMIVKLLNLNLPIDAELWAVLDGNGKIASVVETSELAGWDRSSIKGTSNRLLWYRLFLGLVQADDLSSETFTFLKSGYIICDKLFETKIKLRLKLENSV